MTETVLVTGGCGFIGTWVVRALLEKQARVVVLDQESNPERWARVLGDRASEVVLTPTSLIDRDGIQKAIVDHKITRIIHLAAMLTPACQKDPFLGCQINVLGSAALFDAAQRSGLVKAIALASSYAVYSENPADKNATPPMFYGAFKQAVDLIAEQYWRHFSLPSIAIRPHVVYGPERMIGLTAGPSLACRAAALGEPFTISYSGPAGYDYVEDVASAFVTGVFDCPNGATIVDLPGAQATTADFVREIETAVPGSVGRIGVSGPPIPANQPPIPRDIRQIYPHWQPTPLTEGIRKTIAYYRQGGN